MHICTFIIHTSAVQSYCTLRMQIINWIILHCMTFVSEHMRRPPGILGIRTNAKSIIALIASLMPGNYICLLLLYMQANRSVTTIDHLKCFEIKCLATGGLSFHSPAMDKPWMTKYFCYGQSLLHIVGFWWSDVDGIRNLETDTELVYTEN